MLKNSDLMVVLIFWFWFLFWEHRFYLADILYLYSRYSEVRNLEFDVYRGPALCFLGNHAGQTKVCPHQVLLTSLQYQYKKVNIQNFVGSRKDFEILKVKKAGI